MKRISRPNQASSKKNTSFLIILLVAFALRTGWIIFTNHTYEDAFITFQFARRIAEGQGFVYNPGSKIYGTSTPLFTLLLSGWYLIFDGYIVTGARIFNLLSTLGTFVILYRSLNIIEINHRKNILVLSLLALWPKLWITDTGGMETPLVIFFITLSWFTYLKGYEIWTGIISGILLWTRIDLILWPISLFLLDLTEDLNKSLRSLYFVGITYLPWVVFSTLYFGSPIPHTVKAKWVAYGSSNNLSFIVHIMNIIKRLAPVGIGLPGQFHGLAAVFTWLIILLAILGGFSHSKNKPILALPVFVLLEVLLLSFFKASYTSRYVIPILWGLVILGGLGLGEIWEKLFSNKNKVRGMFPLLLSAGLIILLIMGFQEANVYKSIQKYRNQMSLKSIGLWINQNTEPQSKIQLEPLGYAGYYSNRYMLDIVGLITPEIVDLKRQGITDPYLYLYSLNPDLFIVHCDDILNWQHKEQSLEKQILTNFEKVVQFNPLGFNPEGQISEFDFDFWISRGACYEIWQRK
ncbi:MAG: hypothetical protein U5K99_02010 [Anaerolineales bacterium]|nr:hypothetical protein [Anaerolineales bacterium]